MVEGSPGDSAGVLAGDQLLAVDDTRIRTGGDLGALNDLIPEDEGESFGITLLRDGEELDIVVTTRKLLLKTALPRTQGGA